VAGCPAPDPAWEELRQPATWHQCHTYVQQWGRERPGRQGIAVGEHKHTCV
jgi:hypothetical protein